MKAASLLTAVLFLVTPYPPANAQRVEVSRHVIKATVEDWNTAHNEKNTVKLESLYAAEVTFYGHKLSTAQCLNRKTTIFNASPDYHQEIVAGALMLTAYSSGIIKCEFTKQVTVGSKIQEYPCYLLLKRTSSGYQITGESDATTDRKMKHTPPLGDRQVIVDVDPPAPAPADEATNYVSLLPKLIGLLMAFVVVRYGWKRLRRRQTELSDSKILNASPRHGMLPANRRQATPRQQPATVDYDMEVEEATYEVEVAEADWESGTDEPGLTNWEKGFAFEEYTVNKFNEQAEFFQLLVWRGDKRTNTGVSAISNQYPDLEYRFYFPKTSHTQDFAVECKFRSTDFNNGIIKLCNLSTLNRYRRYQTERNIKVYIYIGLGGAPWAPEKTFLVALDVVKDNYVHRNFLKPYERKVKKKFFFDPQTHRLN